MEIPIIWLPGSQRFHLVLLDHKADDQEPKPENKEAINEQNHEEEEDDEEEDDDDNGGDLISILLKDPRLLHSIIQQTRPKQIESSPIPQRKDLKRKGIDCSVTHLPPAPPRRNHEKGQCSYAVCVICGDTVPQGEAIKFGPCGHPYCTECFPVYLREKIQENALEVKCPVSNCETLFGPKGVRRFIPEEVFYRWVSCVTESSVLAEPVYVRCPFEVCGKLFVDDERGFLIRACPNCWRVFCMKCRVGWHMGKSCLQYEVEVELERRLLTGRPRRPRRRVEGRSDCGYHDHRVVDID